jgi:hypothetical protein
MSALDKIIKRAKQGSSGSTPSRLLSSNKSKKIEDDDDYKTIVDRPSSTYALTPYKSTKSIPSNFTNDFERIYQVVKSSYNCGQVEYKYEECKYDNLVQNYIQKGVADVSSMQGYSNVSLQDLPLACNIPSVVYQNCSLPTNMLTTEVTQNEAGFRLSMGGWYLYPNSDNTSLTFLQTTSNTFNKNNATFLLEKISIKQLDSLIVTNAYNTYKANYPGITNFYYLKHRDTNKYVTYEYKLVAKNEFNFFINRIIGENINGFDFFKSNTYPIIFETTLVTINKKTTNTIETLSQTLSIQKVNGVPKFTGEVYPFLIEKNIDMSQVYPVLLNDLATGITDLSSVKLLCSDNLRYIIVYDISNIPKNYFYLSKDYGITFSKVTLNYNIKILKLSSNGKLFLTVSTQTNSSPSSIYINNTDNIIVMSAIKTFWNIYDINLNIDATLIFVVLNNGSLHRCTNIWMWEEVTDVSYQIIDELSSSLKDGMISSYSIVFDVDSKGKNLIFTTDLVPHMFVISKDYGATLKKVILSTYQTVNTVKCYKDEFYITVDRELYIYDSNTNLFKLIFRDNSATLESYKLYIISVSEKYIMCFITRRLTYQNSSYYIIKKKTGEVIELFTVLPNNDVYIPNNTMTNVININHGFTNRKQYLTKLNEIDLSYLFRTLNGLNYPSYAHSINQGISNGVKYVSDFNTYILKSNTEDIKKIRNFTLKRNTILKGTTVIYTSSKELKDIACSSDDKYIIAASYNGNIILSINGNGSNPSFSIIDEVTKLSGNSGVNSIQSINRYWVSVACSNDGLYMSACAYNGNIFIIQRLGNLINDFLMSSSPENFSKKWVQIAMNADGIIQVACAEDGLFISYNRGLNWKEINNDIIYNALNSSVSSLCSSGRCKKWSSVAVSSSGRYIIATVYDGNVFISYNYGYDWTVYGTSRKLSYEPVIYPSRDLPVLEANGNFNYYGYIISASSPAPSNLNSIINAFMEKLWLPSSTDLTPSVTIELPYNFLLKDINIQNRANIQDLRVSVEGSIPGTNLSSTISNLNLYSTVPFDKKFKKFKITFNKPNIAISNISLIGLTDFDEGGNLSTIDTWTSCSIINETTHYISSDNNGIYRSIVSLASTNNNMFLQQGTFNFKPIFDLIVSKYNLDWTGNWANGYFAPKLSNNQGKIIIFSYKNFDIATEFEFGKIDIGIAIIANDNKIRFLYDDEFIDTSSSKLVPQFSEFNYLQFINENKQDEQNFKKFIWCLSYVDVNTFTIQNNNTGRFLKAFNYYDSTYVYVGDNSSLDFNTRLWFLQRD